MIETFYLIMLLIQLGHSIEELSNNFHKQFPPFPMSFQFFLGFEIIFFSFWLLVLLWPSFPMRVEVMAFFILLMFANGLWHMVWWGIEKKYVPGLVTAPLFIITFLVFYFRLIV